MKKIKCFSVTVLIALVTMSSFSSCDLLFLPLILGIQNGDPDSINYPLDLSFQDASGNDLVSGIKMSEWGYIAPGVCRLSVAVSNSCEDKLSDENLRSMRDNSYLYVSVIDGYSFIQTATWIDPDKCSDEKVLTYSFTCLHVFGDATEHKLVTYWDVPKKQKGITYAKCTRIEFEGKVFTPVDDYTGFGSMAVIILEDKEKP